MVSMAYLDDIENTIWVYAPDNKKYAFQKSKTMEHRGYITVKCPDGTRRNVTGSRSGSQFFPDPRGKNANAFDPPPVLPKAEDYPRERLGPPVDLKKKLDELWNLETS